MQLEFELPSANGLPFSTCQTYHLYCSVNLSAAADYCLAVFACSTSGYFLAFVNFVSPKKLLFV